jgi:thiol-disulfide isomerase/thioredoxin
LAHFVHDAIVMKALHFLGMAALCTAAFVSPALAVEAGQPAPALALPSIRGDVVDLAKLRGRVLYVDFWASWCGPCRRSFPWMNEMENKYGARGFTVIAVNVDKKRADADKFLTLNPANFAIVFDESGATPTAWAVKGMPSSYLVDTRGNVTFVERGFLDENKGPLEERIKALLAAKH